MSVLKANDPQMDNKITISDTQEQKNKHFKAYMLQLTSSICLVIMQLHIKQLSLHFSPFFIIGIRGSLLFLFNLWLIHVNGLSFNIRSSHIFHLLVKRSIISSFFVAMYLGSLPYLPIGVANTLFNTGPIMTIFIEAYLLKKATIHPIHIVFTIVSFSGIVLIIQPEFIFGNSSHNGNIFFEFTVLMAAFLSSFSIVFLHELGGKCNELVTLQYGYFIQGIGSYIFYIFSDNSEKGSMCYLMKLDIFEASKLTLLIIFTVFFSFITQYCRAKSVYLCSPALVQPFSYSTVILGVFIDIVFLQASYDLIMVFGVLIASIGLFSKLIILKWSRLK